jgi:hypothetical protein
MMLVLVTVTRPEPPIVVVLQSSIHVVMRLPDGKDIVAVSVVAHAVDMIVIVVVVVVVGGI